MVLFDIPSSNKSEQKIASKFRNKLLDLGFTMMQYSVYIKFCPDKYHIEKYEKIIRGIIPKIGNINILKIQNQQYANMISFNDNQETKLNEFPKQYQNF